MAVLAPMPRASVSTATAVKPGFFSNWRKANLRSVITQCHHGIDFGCAARRKPTRQHGDRIYPSGLFFRFESIWNQQSNRGYTPELPSDDFWQFNLFAGYRF